MNLEKLFQMQKELDDRILAEHPIQEGEDRLAKKILALQVELGELANCWRGFKYWSNDQKPRTEELGECPLCKGTGDLGAVWAENCIECGGTGKVVVKNPLLEEYVDCLHFILSIGNDLGFKHTICPYAYLEDTTMLFIEISYKASDLADSVCNRDQMLYGYAEDTYYDLFRCFIKLGKKLGFTWEQVEHAYYQKNKENFRRQEEGY